MEKLTITATLASPVVRAGGYMTFDGLIASTIFDRLMAEAGQGTDPLSLVDAAHDAVPIRRTDGLFFASAATLQGLRGRQAFVANIRAVHDLDPDAIAKDRAKKVTVSMKRRRQYGAVLSTYDTIHASSVEWTCTGDGEAIERLLAGVHFIGKRRASGCGEVTEWTVVPGDLDGVVGFLGDPLRPVPEGMFGEFGGDTESVRADAAWRPAYWHPDNRAICFVPSVA